MGNKNEKNNGSGMRPAVRIGALVMALLMILGTFGTIIYALFS